MVSRKAAGRKQARRECARVVRYAQNQAASPRLFPLVCVRCLKAGPPGGIVDKCAHCGALADIPSKPEKEGP